MREQASLAACETALRLGLAPPRVALAQEVRALRLASLYRWEEAVGVLRELTRLRPRDVEARLRLGAALLHGLGRPSEAVEALQEAHFLAPGNARVQGELALAYNQLGEHALALAAFGEALSLDASYLDLRPASREARFASQRGERWP